ncbi:Hsp20/alpha crystallin family protein [Pseudoflavonifractor sp. 524-17]|uniref:Hsp20/alpha crystallin family protein n=1 Tax=Pseudoflavonifractor sp. 524-17 TaxID=2304577 RepID=UPI00137B1497|nr:Hsp20/alpha crystallin family protein [Pseudoflavonifractor sp. 524-17]NCE64361.1 Hsp20/alpha crystallin family protein [Pseudoflavonifractor sp. 524-17]
MFGMLPFERGNDNFFDTFDNFQRKVFGDSAASLPAFRTDIRDGGTQFVLEAELPGFRKEDIKLDLKDGILTISAEHTEKKEEKDGKGQYIRRERRYGSFSRSFDVTGIDESGITAAYRDGILELCLPKAKPVLPEARRITIE